MKLGVSIQRVFAIVVAVMVCAFLARTSLQMAPAGAADEIFIVKSTAKTPDAVADAIKAYAENKKWLFLGANKVAKGAVTLVKLCIPEVGGAVLSGGMELSAMLPCGNIGVYEKGGSTQVSMLHPRYMQMLSSNPAVAKAVGIATPLLLEMLDEVTK